jgi:cob(I)alamin adenosyltransferase
MKIYTRKGDDGTTGLLFGGRVRKDSTVIEVNGAVDEAQAALGVARSETSRGGELDGLLIELERELWVLMAEVATAPENRRKLVAATSLVTAAMVEGLEQRIDELEGRVSMPAEFVVPGQSRCGAALDLARTVVRRAERLALGLELEGSFVGAYLNRLSDLCWMLARFEEGSHLLARSEPRRRGESPEEDSSSGLGPREGNLGG